MPISSFTNRYRNSPNSLNNRPMASNARPAYMQYAPAETRRAEDGDAVLGNNYASDTAAHWSIGAYNQPQNSSLDHNYSIAGHLDRAGKIQANTINSFRDYARRKSMGVASPLEEQSYMQKENAATNNINTLADYLNNIKKYDPTRIDTNKLRNSIQSLRGAESMGNTLSPVLDRYNQSNSSSAFDRIEANRQLSMRGEPMGRSLSDIFANREYGNTMQAFNNIDNSTQVSRKNRSGLNLLSEILNNSNQSNLGSTFNQLQNNSRNSRRAESVNKMADIFNRNSTQAIGNWRNNTRDLKRAESVNKMADIFNRNSTQAIGNWRNNTRDLKGTESLATDRARVQAWEDEKKALIPLSKEVNILNKQYHDLSQSLIKTGKFNLPGGTDYKNPRYPWRIEFDTLQDKLNQMQQNYNNALDNIEKSKDERKLVQERIRLSPYGQRNRKI